ncbi:hypothetical protein BpHYR1_051745 [Brachionus plicatilis]|uniref:Uncharacterized protein n=1 Tax=Brachionus plicatilis TaxID=10195 RepID=A0A3M7T004_BRAPC|nr:hypothetical protein BpHYR1_051745 [Brachionus plicatilis]
MDDLSCLFGDLNLNLNDGLNLIKSSRNKKDGWHYALQSTIKTHPHLLYLVNSLKLEQSKTENLYIQLSTGLVNKRKIGYIVLEEKLNQAILGYNQRGIMS